MISKETLNKQLLLENKKRKLFFRYLKENNLFTIFECKVNKLCSDYNSISRQMNTDVLLTCSYFTKNISVDSMSNFMFKSKDEQIKECTDFIKNNLSL